MELTPAQSAAIARARGTLGGPTAAPAAASAVPAVSPDVRARAVAAVQERQNEITTRGQVLPIGVTRGGQVQLAVPEFLVGPVQTITDLMSGKRKAEQISGQEMFDLGMTVAQLGPMTAFKSATRATAVAPVTEAARNIGVDLPRAVASDSVAVRAATNVASAVPFGGQPVRGAADKALGQLEEAAAGVKGALGTSSVRDAGAAIEKGLTEFAGDDGVLSRRVADAYAKVDSLIDPKATASLDSTLALANEKAARAAAAGIQPDRAVQTVLEAATRPEGLTYEAVKTLRTKVGGWIKSPPLAAAEGVSEKEASAVYAALTRDLETVVKSAGGEPALKAWQTANSEASKAADIGKALGKILKTGNEGEGALFNRLADMTTGGAKADVETLGLAREAIGDKNWSTVLSAMVERWGFDEHGEFQPKQFMSRWAKVTPEAKSILFKTAEEKAHSKALDDIATVSEKAAALRGLAEPKPGGVIKGAIGLAGASALVGVTLDPVSAVAPVVGARVLSNVLAKPQGAPAFATWAKAYEAFVATPNNGTAAVLRKTGAALAFRIAAEEGLDAVKERDLATVFANLPATQAQKVEQGRREILTQMATKGVF